MGLLCICSGAPQFKSFTFRQQKFRFPREEDLAARKAEVVPDASTAMQANNFISPDPKDADIVLPDQDKSDNMVIPDQRESDMLMPFQGKSDEEEDILGQDQGESEATPDQPKTEEMSKNVEPLGLSSGAFELFGDIQTTFR